MIILYDHQMFSIQKYGGITRYFCELIKNLPSEHKFYLPLLFSDNIYLKENRHLIKKLDILPGINFKGKSYLKKRIYSINQLYSKYCISNNKFDLFHPTYYDNYFLKVLKKPYILTVHDLIVFKYKNASDNPDLVISQMKEAIKNASRIISVSENTKKDLTAILNVNPDKIDVVYHGFNRSSEKNIRNHFGRYILYVGRRQGYKNFAAFALAVSRLLKCDKDLKLVCVGEPFDSKEKFFLKELSITEQTNSVKVSDRQLNSLYASALLFVFPSLYEGFGIPILEAFGNNCPVCLSHTSCFPEIAGNAGAYFDPLDVESIYKSMEKVIYDRDFANDLIKAGNDQLKNFSWDKTVDKTLRAYQKTI